MEKSAFATNMVKIGSGKDNHGQGSTSENLVLSLNFQKEVGGKEKLSGGSEGDITKVQQGS